MEVVPSHGHETILPEFWGGGVGFVRVMYETDRAARISFGNDGGRASLFANDIRFARDLEENLIERIVAWTCFDKNSFEQRPNLASTPYYSLWEVPFEFFVRVVRPSGDETCKTLTSLKQTNNKINNNKESIKKFDDRMAAGSFPRSDRPKVNARGNLAPLPRRKSHRDQICSFISFLQIRIIRSAWNHAAQPDTAVHLCELDQRRAEQSFPRTFVFERIGTPSASSTRRAEFIRQYRCKKYYPPTLRQTVVKGEFVKGPAE